MRRKLAVIGSHGMLGSDLIRFLREDFDTVGIHRRNYTDHVGDAFDIVVNANGNSRRFWANANPLEDFRASVESTYRSLLDFTTHLYIYISSSDVYEHHTSPRYTKEDSTIVANKLTPYGFHKYLSELFVQKYSRAYLILRSSMILGSNLKKGPFYDILHQQPLFIAKTSKLQLITTAAIVDIIKMLLVKKVSNQTINIGGLGTFCFEHIVDYIDIPITFRPDGEEQTYEMNVERLCSYYPIRTSQEYLREFLRSAR